MGRLNLHHLIGHYLEAQDGAGNYLRQAKTELATGKYLDTANHYFGATAWVGHYQYPGSKTLRVRFQYGISNSGGIYWGGQKVEDLSLQYTAQ